MGIHHFTDHVCDKCKEYAGDDLAQCYKCDSNICNDCILGYLPDMIDEEVQNACLQLYKARYKTFHEKEVEESVLGSLDFYNTLEFNKLVKRVKKTFEIGDSEAICGGCCGKVADTIRNALYGYDPQSLSEHLLDFTDFKNMDDAKAEYGSFENFLALRAGFKNLTEARQDYTLRTERNMYKGCKKIISRGIKSRKKLFTELMARLFKNEPCNPTNEADLWFLKNVHVQEFVKAEKKEKIIQDYIDELVHEWEFDLYLNLENGQEHWKKEFQNRQDNL